MKIRSKLMLLTLAMHVLLAGCSSLTIEPSKMGAENDCAAQSATPSQYNDCMERVDANFRAYEQQKRIPD